MDPKSTVVKSKSSNSGISKKSEEGPRRQYDKKTRSNANFPRHGMKKRGVYVEKRLTKTNLVNNGKDIDSIAQKPPPRPRPGQKKFLASVLTILSKSTTGTQYPESNELAKECKREKIKNKTSMKHQNTSEEDGVIPENHKKNTKEKFKSRILNKKLMREDKKKMVVLQSKKEIAQTPSNYSEWSYKDASQNSNVSNLMICEDSNNNGGLNIANELKNAVLEGRNAKMKKQVGLDDEPKTLVSDRPKVQKNLYNFFVDLLETTISVYNVKADYDEAVPIKNKVIQSKTNLQINESVANKLNVGKVQKTIEFDDHPYVHHIENDVDFKSNFINTKMQPIRIPKSFKREAPIKTTRKIKAKSFLNSNNTHSLPQKSKSVEIKRKFRNKNDLINALKQQLEVDTYIFEEPKSIFQALRVMARNKKKITFDPLPEYKTYTDECVFKRRKVISSRKLKKRNKDEEFKVWKPVKPVFNNADHLQNTRKLYPDITNDSDEVNETASYQSLEVHGFDYEPRAYPTSHFNSPRDISFAYHSSPSNSDLEFDDQELILDPAIAFSSVRKFSTDTA